MLFIWGVAGAFVYATNAFIFQIWNEGATTRGRIKAGAEYAAALSTGGIFALGLTGVMVTIVSGGVNINGLHLKMELDPIAVALTIGWGSNYLWPRLLRKLGNRVDTFGNEGKQG